MTLARTVNKPASGSRVSNDRMFIEPTPGSFRPNKFAECEVRGGE